MTAFTPFVAHTVLPAAELNTALSAVESEALAAAAAADADAGKAMAAAEAAQATANAAATSAATGTVKTVNGVGPDGAGTVSIPSGAGAAGSRPSLGALTDTMSPSGSGWTDDGKSFLLSVAPVQTSGSAAAQCVYAGKPCSAYGSSSKVRTLTAHIVSSFPEADGLKVGLALHDPASATFYTAALGFDVTGLANSGPALFRPSGPLVQAVTGLSSAGSGTRTSAPVYSLPHAGELWLRLTDTQGSGVTGGFSRDGTTWVPLPLSLSYGSTPPTSPTWGLFADIGINQGADWNGALDTPATVVARILSLVEG